MNTLTKSELEMLRANYCQIKGHPFNHFYCPILWRDDDVPLCEGHIINQAFPNSALDWTIQRQDVDNFYGSVFEDDFLSFRYYENRSVGNAFIDKSLSKRLKPKILFNGKTVNDFVAQDDLPEQFTRLDFEHDGRVISLGLKIPPEDVIGATNENWEIVIDKDIRIAALASLIKAAHLTLFKMVGYQYALSSGGYFVGRQILGEFFYQNRGKKKSQALKNAHPFFREFSRMVRPFQVNTLDLQGTISDKLVFVCGVNNSDPWALVVFIKTSSLLSG